MWKKGLKLIFRFVLVTSVVVITTFLLLFSGSQTVAEKVLASQAIPVHELGAAQFEKEQARLRAQLGLDLPLFYVRITSAVVSREWNPNLSPSERKTTEKWAVQSGNYSASLNLIEVLKKESTLSQLRYRSQLSAVLTELGRYELSTDLANAVSHFHQSKGGGRWLPRIHFYGNNQFHRWLFGNGADVQGVIRGDFGRSYINGQKVWDIIQSRIGWSLFFGAIATLLAFVIGIAAGSWMAFKNRTRPEKWVSGISYLLYSAPSFWLATLLLMTFANPAFLNWFPTGGVEPLSGIPEDTNWFERMRMVLPYTVLPLVCFTYGSAIYLARMVKQSTNDVLGSLYVRAAQIRAVPSKNLLRNYVVRNALLPTITVFGAVFPALIGGSVILETVFSIPGLGNQVFHAANQSDVPLLMAIVLLTAFLSVGGYYVSDLLYKWADPRIKLEVS